MDHKFRCQQGDKIGGRYQVHKALAGGMGEVYLCMDLQENFPFALKTFQGQHQGRGSFQQTFEREVGTWVALEKHANIVRCFYLDTIENQPFMFLEWIAGDERYGVDLRGWLGRGPLESQKALGFAIDVGRGLMHAVDRQPGIVHCDLKPENILIAQGGVAKITDFGLARIAQQAELNPAESRGAGAHLSSMGGTPLYMAPEQWLGKELDARTDIYGLGCILYEMLTGCWPYSGRSIDQLKHQHCQSTLPALSSGKKVLDALAEIVMRCMAKVPGDRYPNVESLVEELTAIHVEHFGPPRPAPQAGEMFAEDYNNRGRTYAKLRRYDEALSDYQRGIEIHPEEPIFYSNIGRVYHSLGREHQALEKYTQSIELDIDHNDEDVYSDRGFTYHELGEYELALEDYEHAIDIDPGNPRVYNNRGLTYHVMKRYNEALLDYDRAIQLDREYSKAYYNRGNTYDQMKEIDRAFFDFGQAIKFDPKNAAAFNNRGLIYKLYGKVEEATSDFSHAISIKPESSSGYFNRATIYLEKMQYSEALEDFRMSIKCDSPPLSEDALVQVSFNAGAILANTGKLELSLIYFEQAARRGHKRSVDTIRDINEMLER